MTLHPRCIGVVTTGRADYAISLPVLRRIQSDSALRLHLYASGTHLSPAHGLTANAVEADGFAIDERVDMLLSSDTPEGVGKSMGLGIIGFAQCYARFRPDILVVCGDRFEMHAAALAALPFGIPVAHVEGGDITEGAIDDALRHSMTKLSHLHFVSTQDSARRVVQMGEEPWRVVVAGAPSLDNLRTMKLLNAVELEDKYGLPLRPPPLLVTFHPVTLEYDQTLQHVTALVEALKILDRPIVMTMPNADTSGSVIARALVEFAASRSSVRLIENLGTRDYLSMLACAAAVVGNSSSGIIEAPSFGLPAVNIGSRQRGRVRGANVIDVGYTTVEIVEGIRQALEPAFRARLRDLVNPYGTGDAAAAILERLSTVSLDSRLTTKTFFDVR